MMPRFWFIYLAHGSNLMFLFNTRDIYMNSDSERSSYEKRQNSWLQLYAVINAQKTVQLLDHMDVAQS